MKKMKKREIPYSDEIDGAPKRAKMAPQYDMFAPSSAVLQPSSAPEVLQPSSARQENGTSSAAPAASNFSATSSTASLNMSAFQKRLMEKSGWKEGAGLGRAEQGITQPIQAVQKMGMGGLGLASKVMAQQHDNEEITVESLEIKWAPSFLSLPPGPVDSNVIAACRMESVSFGPLPREPDDSFCSRHLQTGVLEAKSVLDHVERRRMVDARNRSNPFEMLKKEFFQNRAALKMAELDALCGRVFTAPPDWLKSQQGQKGKKGCRKLLYFADICAGPGGFSEYMLHVLKWRAKGFGFTLTGKLDFKLGKFNSNAPTESFKAYYGKDETGDITVTANMRDFATKAWAEAGGMDVVLADGGFLFEGKENLQELMVRQLVLCQCSLGMALLRKGGVFLCKVFDTWTPFTVHVCFIVSRHFDQFAIVKPHQSRPANSERYLLGVGFKSIDPKCLDFLYGLNDEIRRMKAENPNILDGVGTQPLGLIPVSQLDEEFVRYMYDLNTQLASQQIAALTRLKKYIEDQNLLPDDQEEVRRKCLEAWDLQDSKDRQNLSRRKICLDKTFGQKHFSADPRFFFQQHSTVEMNGQRMSSSEFLYQKKILHEIRELQRKLEPDSTEKPALQQTTEMSGISDWWAYLIPAGGKRLCLMSTPRGMYSPDPAQGGIRLQPLKLRIPKDTILDVVMEQQKSGEVLFHVLDAWSLPSEPDFYQKRPLFEDRISLLSLFVEAIREPCLKFSSPLTVDALLKEQNISSKDVYLLKGNGPKPSSSRFWSTSMAADFPYENVRKYLSSLIRKQQERCSSVYEIQVSNPSISQNTFEVTLVAFNLISPTARTQLPSTDRLTVAFSEVFSWQRRADVSSDPKILNSSILQYGRWLNPNLLHRFQILCVLCMRPAFTTTHSLEAIEDLLEGPLIRYKFYLKSQGGAFFEEVLQDQGPSDKAEVPTATENQEDLNRALEAKGGISQQKCGLMWKCPRCRKYKSFTGGKFCAIDGHPCIVDEYGRKILFQRRRPCDNPLCAYMLDREQRQVACPNCKVRQAWDEVKKPAQGTSWDMTALDALPALKHGQPPSAFTDGGEYFHCCSFLNLPLAPRRHTWR
eukprot:g46429.t1